MRSRLGLMAILAALPLLLLAVGACGKAPAGDPVRLELAEAVSVSAPGETVFDAEGSTVLRCASFMAGENSLTGAISKAKSMKATTLVFLPAIQPADREAGRVIIAAAPVTGKEYEYDMTRARFYAVTPASADAAAGTYGLPFNDWLTGACNASEKFPCCQ